MKRNDAFPSQYMGQDDLVNGPIQMTIADVRLETIKGEHGTEDKPVMFFVEDEEKKMVVNATNWTTLEEAYGPDSNEWAKRPVEIYVDPGVTYGGKRVGGLRLRIPAGTAVKTGSASLTLAQAIMACAGKGISRESLIAHLKEQGHSEYNIKRDTPAVRAFLASQSDPLGEPAAAEGPTDDIPFN